MKEDSEDGETPHTAAARTHTHTETDGNRWDRRTGETLLSGFMSAREDGLFDNIMGFYSEGVGPSDSFILEAFTVFIPDTVRNTVL